MTTPQSLAGGPPARLQSEPAPDGGGLGVVVVYGSVRQAREGVRAARFVVRQLEARGHAASLVDPVEVALPMLDRTFGESAEGGAEGGAPASAVLVRLAELYRAADAFVFVTGEYNHSVPPALKNLVDHFLKEYFWRPAGIVSYSSGHFGGVRAAVHLRAVLGEVGLVTVPSMLPVPHVGDAFDESGAPADAGAWAGRAGRFLDELCWYARALRVARAGGVPY